MPSKDHWEQVYSSKPAASVSWFQEHAEQSLRLIRGTGVPCSAATIDVGGGASTLVDDLLADGYNAVTVLDLSAAALAEAKTRLGEAASRVQWLRAYQYDGQEMAGFPWAFRKIGGDCFPRVCENYDFHIAYFAADLALALVCAFSAGYLAVRLCRKRLHSP